nr:MAG TPA: hypothetical protein [Caudoviricetes sp.]
MRTRNEFDSHRLHHLRIAVDSYGVHFKPFYF